MKKILYIWKAEFPWEVRASKFCSTLSANEYEVMLLSRRGMGLSQKENKDGIDIRRVGGSQRGILSAPVSGNPIWKKAIESAIREFNPDIIIVREIMLAETSARIAGKYDIPVIMDMSENYPAVMKGWRKYKDNIFRRMAVHWFQIPEKIEKRSVILMDGIITVCEEQCSRLNEKYNYPFEKMEIVRNTPDLKEFDSLEKKIIKKAEKFAYHGYVNDERNLGTFLKGFITAARKNKKIILEIAGSGEELTYLKKMVDDEKIQDRISFTGEYTPEELKRLYTNTDIAVLPYKINDHINNTISNKLFDYMALGKPMIVSKAIPMVRLMNETGAGISVDCNSPDDISEAILDIQNMNLEKMSQNGQKAASEKYNWETDSKKLVEFIRKYI